MLPLLLIIHLKHGTMHKRALKLVLQKSSTPTVDDYKKLNILPFKKGLVFNKCVCMYNIVNRTFPKNIINTFTTNRKRHTHKLSFPTPRTNLFKSGLMFSGETIWNNVPFCFKAINGLSTVRKALKKTIYRS